MEGLVTFNLNCPVYLQLKPEGVEIYRNHYGIAPDKIAERIASMTDDNGLFRLQLHEVMSVFGPYVNGFHFAPFATSVYIKETDLDS